MTYYSQVHFNAYANAVSFIPAGEVNKSHIKSGDNNCLVNNIKEVKNHSAAILSAVRPKTVIVGYSPTGGGHTGRTLNIISAALRSGCLPAGSQMIFHVPPRWENTPRPAQLTELATESLKSGIEVKFVESDKPVYGYLNKITGGSDDASILTRMALQPLRNEPRNARNAFLNKYFPDGNNIVTSVSQVKNFAAGDPIDHLKVISANHLINSVISENQGDTHNIIVLTDMDPALQKAAQKYGVPEHQRMDQQNHAILLISARQDKNLSLHNALLAKVLDARGGLISHISLGGKNTLSSIMSAAARLDITPATTWQAGKEKVHQLLLSVAQPAHHNTEEIAQGCVIKGQGVSQVKDIEKVVYIYAHKKTPLIASHIARQIAQGSQDYQHKIFIFCGRDAVPGYNALHLALLADADGITTAGAGTCGEFAYLHRQAGAKSNLLILPIEDHNEQEAIADALCSEFPDHMLRLAANETLEDGRKIDRLVTLADDKPLAAAKTYGEFIAAVSQPRTYVSQGKDILFNQAEMDAEAKVYQRIERAMYLDRDMKATRYYLKLCLQLFSYLVGADKAHIFPVEIRFKQDGPAAVILNHSDDARALLNSNEQLQQLLNMSSKNRINSLPLLKEVRALINTELLSLPAEKINRLKDQFGHYMTTGF